MSSVAASKTGGRLLGGYFVLLAIFLYAPLAVMIIFAFDDSFVQTFPWSGFTTKWFHNAFSNTELIDALKRSVWIGIAAAIGATLLGLMTAVGMTAHKLTTPRARHGARAAAARDPVHRPRGRTTHPAQLARAARTVSVGGASRPRRRLRPLLPTHHPPAAAHARPGDRGRGARPRGRTVDGVQAGDPAADRARALLVGVDRLHDLLRRVRDRVVPRPGRRGEPTRSTSTRAPERRRSSRRSSRSAPSSWSPRS